MNQKVFVLRTSDIVHELAKFLAKIFKPDGVLYEVIIQPFKDKRSIQQNRYYWVVMGLLSKEFGYTKDELHEYFKSEFLAPKESVVLGVSIKEYASTTKLKKAEFAEYMELISQRMAENGFAVPAPLALGYEF